MECRSSSGRVRATSSADSQTEDQAARHHVDERDEPETGHKRLRCIVEKTNRIVSSEPTELSIEFINPKVAAAAVSSSIVVGIAQRTG